MEKKPSTRFAPPLVIDAARFISYAFSKLVWRIQYHDRQNVPQNLKTGLIIVANHQTYFDPFWICAPLKRKYRFLAWDKAFEWFFVGWLIRYLGAFPVDTKRGTSSKKVFRETLNSLRDGATVLIFPEAAREFSEGKLLEFKTGAVRIALAAGVPILPVTVRGGNKIWAQGMKYPRPGKVEIFYHPLFEIEKSALPDDSREHLEELTAQIAEIIASKLTETTRGAKI